MIARTTRTHFSELNAVTAGVADIRKVVEAAKERLVMDNQRTTLFVDEIHRFNKSQQDALLPYVEEGTIILIGATTENPFSRSIRRSCRVRKCFRSSRFRTRNCSRSWIARSQMKRTDWRNCLST